MNFPQSSLWLQGLVFSATAIGLIAFLGWWLYFSPARGRISDARRVPPVLSRVFGLLIGLGVILISVGGYWDASEHVVTGIVPGGEDFLWPAHLMIYAGFLISFLVASVGLVLLARPNLAAGVADPRLWVRRNPYFGAAVLVAGYGLLSIPGDAIWHELYGVDLTAWSPPHIFLVAASVSTGICAIGLLLQSRRSPEVDNRLALWVLALLAMVLSEAYLIATLEWELGTVGGYVLTRPSWLYPTLVGALAFAVLALGRRLVSGPWTATVLAMLYFTWRLGSSLFAETISGAPPRLTLVFLLGAVALDLAAQRMQGRNRRASVVTAAAFTLGYTAVALPTIRFVYLPYLVRFTLPDYLITLAATFVLCALLWPVTQAVGHWLLKDQIETPVLHAVEASYVPGD